MKLCTVTLDLISPIHGRWVAAFTFPKVSDLGSEQQAPCFSIGWETVSFFSETQPGEGGFHKKASKWTRRWNEMRKKPQQHFDCFFFSKKNPSILPRVLFSAGFFGPFDEQLWPNRKNIGAAKQPSENSSAKLSGGNWGERDFPLSWGPSWREVKDVKRWSYFLAMFFFLLGCFWDHRICKLHSEVNFFWNTTCCIFPRQL